MGLFSKKEKKECCCTEEETMTGGCGCGCDCETEHKEEISGKVRSIKILGGGCAKCNQLEANVKEGMNDLGITCEVEHVKDYAEIAAMGVMSLPAWAINDKVVSFGKVLKKAETIEILKKYL